MYLFGQNKAFKSKNEYQPDLIMSKTSSFVFLGASLLSSFLVNLVPIEAAKAWDDKTITEETLWNLCKTGIQANAFNGRGYGYLENILKGRMVMGNTTTRDYQSLRRWYQTNCPDAW